MDMQYREISCQKANTLKDFGVGVQDYNFNVGGATVWYPSKSYFRIKMRITAPGQAATDPGNQPSIVREVALADNVVGNLFDNVYFRGGGQDISSIVSYASQASMLTASDCNACTHTPPCHPRLSRHVTCELQG